jgi:hypothetical protein
LNNSLRRQRSRSSSLSSNSRGSVGLSSYRSTFSGNRKIPHIKNVSTFGKYFILAPKFDTIKEEDESAEAGSLIFDDRAASAQYENSDPLEQGCPETGANYYTPDEIDEIMGKKSDGSKTTNSALDVSNNLTAQILNTSQD